MPTNKFKYPRNFNDAIRPAVLKRDNYKCTVCHLPSRIRYVLDASGLWIEADPTVEAWAKENDVKISKSVLSVSHRNHFTFDNRLENLQTLCGACHLKHDRKHKATVAKFGEIWNPIEMLKALKQKGGETLLNHALEIAKVQGRRYLTLEQIYTKRHTKGYDSKYDLDIKEQMLKTRADRDLLLVEIAAQFKKLFIIPKSMDFISDFLKEENRLIGFPQLPSKSYNDASN